MTAEPHENVVRIASYEDLYRELLPRTLSYAMNECPYYRETYSRHGLDPSRITSKEALVQVPFLHPDVLRYRSSELLDQSYRGPLLVRFTSGTSQSPLHRKYLFFSPQEAERANLAALWSSAQAGHEPPAPAPEGAATTGLALYLQSGALLGSAPTLPGYTVFPHYFDKDFEIYHDLVADMLTRTWNLPGHEPHISVLILNGRFELSHLTNELLKKGINPSETGVRAIASIGDYLIPERRRWLEATWNARVFNTYSMTEVPAPVLECTANPDVKHFDPAVIVEAVDPDSGQPVPDGSEGVLVITCLYPFREVQPLIRYWTADIVTLRSGICDCGFHGTTMVKWHGRTDFSLNLNRELPPSAAPRHLSTATLMNAICRLYPGFTFNQDLSMEKAVEADGTLAISLKLTRSTRLEHLPVTGPCTPESVENELRRELPGWASLLDSGRIRFRISVQDAQG